MHYWEKEFTITHMLPDYVTPHGKIVHRDSLDFMSREIEDETVDLIFTSPPFALLRKKDYGNVEADKYIEWFEQFAKEFYRILKPTGSLVIDIESGKSQDLIFGQEKSDLRQGATPRCP